jgi:hypothetical protein
LAIDSSTTPSTIYAGRDGGVYKSTDGGTSWKHLLRDTSFENFSFVALTIDPGMPGTLYAGTLRSVVKITDGGGTWDSGSTGQNSLVHALALDPASPDTLYAGMDGGVFKSIDGGSTWGAINAGLTTPPSSRSPSIPPHRARSTPGRTAEACFPFNRSPRVLATATILAPSGSMSWSG